MGWLKCMLLRNNCRKHSLILTHISIRRWWCNHTKLSLCLVNVPPPTYLQFITYHTDVNWGPWNSWSDLWVYQKILTLPSDPTWDPIWQHKRPYCPLHLLAMPLRRGNSPCLLLEACENYDDDRWVHTFQMPGKRLRKSVPIAGASHKTDPCIVPHGISGRREKKMFCSFSRTCVPSLIICAM